MDVSDELAEQLRPIRSWLSIVLELSLVGFRTLAIQTASEVISFLSANPTPQEVLDYHVSESAQARLRQLLILHRAGLLGEGQQQELDELEKIEHIINYAKGESGRTTAKEKVMPSEVSDSLRQTISERANHCCEYCLFPQSMALHKHEIDHVVPIQRGGETDKNNLALSY